MATGPNGGRQDRGRHRLTPTSTGQLPRVAARTGGCPLGPRTVFPVAGLVAEEPEKLNAPCPVGEGVADLDHDSRSISGQTLHEMDLPERAGLVEILRSQDATEIENGSKIAWLGNGSASEVERKVWGHVDPAGPTETKGALGHPLTEPRQPLDRPFNHRLQRGPPRSGIQQTQTDDCGS